MAKRGRDHGIEGESERTRRLSTQKLRKRCLTVFQKLRRLQEADSNGNCTCVTCGLVAPWNRGIEGGHYVSSKHNATAFCHANVHPQCTGCNRAPGGKQAEHRAYIVETYGEAVAAELDALKATVVQYYRVDYVRRLKVFNALVRQHIALLKNNE